MNGIGDRAVRILCRVLVIAIAGALLAMATGASAQTAGPSAPPAAAPAKPSTFSGCVQKAPGSGAALVISAPTACAKLTGKVSADQLAGHQVELQGILTPRTSSAAASIVVNSVVKVGASCTDVCSLQPPGTRGLHRPQTNEIPGSEGGTPGLVAPQPQ